MTKTYIGVMISAKTIEEDVAEPYGDEYNEDVLYCPTCKEDSGWTAKAPYKYCHTCATEFVTKRIPYEPDVETRERSFYEVLENENVFKLSKADAKFLRDNFLQLDLTNDEDVLMYKPVIIEEIDYMEFGKVNDKIKTLKPETLERLIKIMKYKKVKVQTVVYTGEEYY